MKLRFRRQRPLEHGESVPVDLYRVAVKHREDDHECSVPFHVGPVYNLGFAETAAHLLDVPLYEVNLLDLAQQGLERVRADHPASEWESWVERLTADGWERVS